MCAVALSAVVVSIISIPATSALSATLAVAPTIVAAAPALGTGRASLWERVHGDETRFPCAAHASAARTCSSRRARVAAGIASGPLLIADDKVVLGAIVLVVGFAVAALARSLHALSRRWVVMVPAGVVVVDPLILLEPALMLREDITRLTRTEPGPRLADALDLRLGSTARSVTILLREPATFGRRRGRTGGLLVGTDVVLVAPVLRDALLVAADRRRIPT